MGDEAAYMFSHNDQKIDTSGYDYLTCLSEAKKPLIKVET